MKKQKYSPQLTSPYYADDHQRGAVLHRYLDDQFISRFSSQAQANILSQDTHSWLTEDLFSNHDNPTLRLPIHRTYYVLCCEAVCDAPGQPALDPSRIESAGFVIRQQIKGEDFRWKVRDGLDIGWDVPQHSGIEEPDEYRYLLNKNYTQARSPEPAYTGEQTYPLSTLLMRDTQANASREHNLLYGFMSLGGQSYPTVNNVNQPALENVMGELTWPLGDYAKDDNPNESWNVHSGHLIENGKLNQAAAELFAMLFERFHLLDIENQQNAELISFLDTIHVQLIDEIWPSWDAHDTAAYLEMFEAFGFWNVDKPLSLYQYLKENTPAIEEWLMKYHEADTELAVANAADLLDEKLHLILSEEQAGDLRLLMARRSLSVIELALSDFPEPRYQRDGLYYAKVFLRYRDEKGCEKIIWGPSSNFFHVATPFDPQASRPHLIQMPDMDDLTRGLANGVAMKLPKSLADAVEKIKPDLGEPAERERENRNDGGWIYVFSLPILTICAMILLMIIVNLLNFIFRWIPWVIQRIPIPK